MLDSSLPGTSQRVWVLRFVRWWHGSQVRTFGKAVWVAGHPLSLECCCTNCSYAHAEVEPRSANNRGIHVLIRCRHWLVCFFPTGTRRRAYQEAIQREPCRRARWLNSRAEGRRLSSLAYTMRHHSLTCSTAYGQRFMRLFHSVTFLLRLHDWYAYIAFNGSLRFQWTDALWYAFISLEMD